MLLTFEKRHVLAEAPQLTPKQEAFAATLFRKYRRQLEGRCA